MTRRQAAASTPPTDPRPYRKVVRLFEQAFAEMQRAGFADRVAKGGVGELLLADFLGHTLNPRAAGWDGRDDALTPRPHFEYKVSTTDQFNFHFGTRDAHDPPDAKIDRHFKALHGVLVARRAGATILEVAYAEAGDMVPFLKRHFRGCTGLQLNKRLSMKAFLKQVPGALRLYP